MLGKKIPKELDKRRKLTDEQKEEIYRRYTDPNNTLSMEKLGQEYGVTKYTVYYIVNPDKRKENSKSSFSKEKHRVYVRNYYRRRRELDKQGVLIDESDEQ